MKDPNVRPSMGGDGSGHVPPLLGGLDVGQTSFSREKQQRGRGLGAPCGAEHREGSKFSGSGALRWNSGHEEGHSFAALCTALCMPTAWAREIWEPHLGSRDARPTEAERSPGAKEDWTRVQGGSRAGLWREFPMTRAVLPLGPPYEVRCHVSRKDVD